MADPGSEDARRPDRAGLLIAAGLVGLAAVIAWDTLNLPPGAASYSRVGPRVFPYGVAICLAGLAVVTAAIALRHGAPPRPREAIAPITWIVGGLIAQLRLLPVAGFSIATGAVFAATARAFGRGPLVLTYPLGVALALAVWLAFARALQLILPAGRLERLALDGLDRLIELVRDSGIVGRLLAAIGLG